MKNTITTPTVFDIGLGEEGYAYFANFSVKEEDPNAKTISFFTRFLADCVLNNLCLDYMTGAELLLYIKTYVATYEPAIWLSGSHPESKDANGFVINIKAVQNLRDLFAKISSPWGKHSMANAA